VVTDKPLPPQQQSLQIEIEEEYNKEEELTNQTEVEETEVEGEKKERLITTMSPPSTSYEKDVEEDVDVTEIYDEDSVCNERQEDFDEAEDVCSSSSSSTNASPLSPNKRKCSWNLEDIVLKLKRSKKPETTI